MKKLKQDSVIMILGARLAQLSAIETAKRMGLGVIAVDPDPAAPGLEIADIRYVYDLADETALMQIVREHDIDGVLTLAADYPMPTIANICEKAGLVGPSQSAVEAATNKRLMRRAFEWHGIPSPRSIHVESPEEAVRAVRKFNTDVIFKPVQSHGGRGITRIHAQESAEVIRVAFDRAKRETRADSVLVEEFVEGPEFSVETITFAGGTRVIAITDKQTSGEPYYVEVGHNQPTLFSPQIAAQLRETTVRAVKALKIDNSGGHTELKLTPDGPVVIEVGARLGGGFINSHLIPLSSGIDMVKLAIEVALGRHPGVDGRNTRGAAIRFLKAEPGTVKAIRGLKNAARLAGVEWLAVYVKPGDIIKPLVDATGRVGHVICTGKSATEAIQLAEAASSAVHVDTE